MATVSWVNPKVLAWARVRMGLELKQVEELSTKQKHKIAVADLAAWEQGVKEPELYDMEVLAEIYACPVGYFMLELVPSEEFLFPI